MILVDAHVHIYDCFYLSTFFNSAFENFKSKVTRLKQGPDTFTGILLLTETSKDNWFEQLKAYANNKREDGNKIFGDWRFHPTDEKSSLRVMRNEQESLLLIAGRQIATREGLEVLALVTEKSFDDGVLLMETIQAVKDSGGIPVIPWGFGKWMRQRGNILKALLKLGKFPELFLGDTGNRPGFLPRPSPFKIGEQRGIRILSGTDPLPLPSECGRAGSFGFSVDVSLSLEHPARDLKQMLMNPTTQLRKYGQPESLYRFIRNQFLLRLNSL